MKAAPKKAIKKAAKKAIKAKKPRRDPLSPERISAILERLAECADVRSARNCHPMATRAVPQILGSPFKAKRDQERAALHPGRDTPAHCADGSGESALARAADPR